MPRSTLAAIRATPALAVMVALTFLIAAFAALPALADKRVALVVGNSAYQNIPRLANPANDAKLMAETLRALGFVLVGGGAQLDLDEGNFRHAVQSFGTQLQGADVGLFYYAGHGLQVRGANYLVPVGANPTREADVDFQLLDTNLVLRQMEGAGTKLNLVILDACRNNPFGGRGLRSVDSGLAQMRAPEGTLISFATQPGNVAQDGAGGNSPYTTALAQTLQRPGLGIFEAFNEVGLAVMQATGDAQQPWVSTSPIRGSFFFAGPSGGDSAAIMTPGPAGDEIAWGFVRNTSDRDLLRQFLSQFAASPHKAEAEARIAALERADEQRRLQRSGQDDVGARIDAMVGPPPPLPDPSEVLAARPFRPAPGPDQLDASGPGEPRPSGRRTATGRPILDFETVQPTVTPRDEFTATGRRKLSADEIGQQIDAMVDPTRSMDTTPNFVPSSSILNKKVKRDVSLGYLYLRKGPGQNFQVVARIPAGANGVAVTGACASAKNGPSALPFCEVQWNGYQGWVASSGLE